MACKLAWNALFKSLRGLCPNRLLPHLLPSNPSSVALPELMFDI
jgi:hypothetical protein